MVDEIQAGNLPAPAPVPATPTPPFDWQTPAKWCAGAALASAVLALELTGHSPNGTFLSIVAAPGLATLGIHSAAKNLN